jgi:hypothetical protein
MRKLSSAFAVLALSAVGLMAPAAAQAAPAAGTAAQAALPCNDKWPGRNGYMYAWSGKDCGGTLLGSTQGSDSDWGNGAGPFQGSDDNSASSLMNAGYFGDNEVLAVYRLTGHQHQEGYGCLLPGEYFASDLSGDVFQNGGYKVIDNRISSHRWVDRSGCTDLSLIS